MSDERRCTLFISFSILYISYIVINLPIALDNFEKPCFTLHCKTHVEISSGLGYNLKQLSVIRVMFDRYFPKFIPLLSLFLQNLLDNLAIFTSRNQNEKWETDETAKQVKKQIFVSKNCSNLHKNVSTKNYRLIISITLVILRLKLCPT